MIKLGFDLWKFCKLDLKIMGRECEERRKNSSMGLACGGTERVALGIFSPAGVRREVEDRFVAIMNTVRHCQIVYISSLPVLHILLMWNKGRIRLR